MVPLLEKWFNSKGGFAHVVAATILMLVAAYDEVPPFANLLNSIYAATPKRAHEVILAIVGLILWYKNVQSKGASTNAK